MLERDGRIVAGPIPNDAEVNAGANYAPNTLFPVQQSAPMDMCHIAIWEMRTHMKRSIMPRKSMCAASHHINSLESHWSLLKRAIKGTHVHISKKHAWKYVSEFSYRRNMRHSHWAMFNLLVHAFALPRLVEP